MKGFSKGSLSGFLGICILWTTCFASLGADSSLMINKVSVTVKSTVTAGDGPGTVTVTSDSDKYAVDSWEFVGGKDDWKAGDVPKVKIYINAQEEYYFSKSFTSSKTSISGATYYNAKPTEENKVLELTVKLKPVKGTLGDVEDAYWETGGLGRAKWEKVENANAYEVRLYKGTTMVHKIDKITGSSCNLYSYMTKAGIYTFKVRAIPRNEDEADYLTSGQWCESTEQEITSKEASQAGAQPKPEYTDSPSGGPPAEQFGWIKDVNGWWYKNPDRKYTSNAWQNINGKWYLFDMAGYMKTGWQNHNGNNYYLTSNGDMVTGWYEDGRKWYYLTESGAAASGWIQINNNWYYFGPEGVMSTGWMRWKDQWYYLSPENGIMLRDTVVNQYYLNQDGVWVP